MEGGTDGELSVTNEQLGSDEATRVQEKAVETDGTKVRAEQQDDKGVPIVPEEAKEPLEEKELEQDALVDNRSRVSAEKPFLTEDTTINVLPALEGRMLMSFGDGAFQYLLGGARASTGVKAGRYMFEVKILESKNPCEPTAHHMWGQSPRPRQLLRVGFASAESSLILADGAGSVCFDSEGGFFGGDQRQKGSHKFGIHQVVAIVLNLDPESPNANTVSLFLDGVRASEPQPLPDVLKGKVMYPAVTYRNLTLQVNLGPQPLKQLPFKCRLICDAAQADSEVSIALKASDGPREILYPIGLPDEGVFDWLDQFLAQNRSYTEISERSILEWARKSGIHRPKGHASKASNDKPGLDFGLPCLDDLSVNNVIAAVAPALGRDFVVMELKGNLIAYERKLSLARFVGPDVRKVARVIIGEPPDEYKLSVRDALLIAKRKKAESDAKRRQAEKEKELARKKARKADEERTRKAESAKKAKEAEQVNGAGEEVDVAEKIEKGEEKEDEKDKDEADIFKPEEVCLTEEEEKQWFRKSAVQDVAARELAIAFTSFSLPQETEGFDAVEFSWQPRDKCEAYLKSWVSAQKLTQKVEHLQPSNWFNERWSEWADTLTAWKKKHEEAKDPARKKAALIASRKKKAEAKKKAEMEAADGEGNCVEENQADGEKADIDVEDLDVFSVDDVMDVGNGQPLFLNFTYEDWMLLSLRFELHLLLHAFRHDVNDTERISFGEHLLTFYYSKYLKKALAVKDFGVENVVDVLKMTMDTVGLDHDLNVLEALFPDDTPLDNFVKLTEDARRERLRQLDSGDESGKLQFLKPAAPPAHNAGGAQARTGAAPPESVGQKRGYPPGPPSPYGMPPKQQRVCPNPYGYGGIVHGAPPPPPRGYGYGALPPTVPRYGSGAPPAYGSPYGGGSYGGSYGAGVNARVRYGGYGDPYGSSGV